jgi:trk system potassium uptake protein TrkA
MKFVIIGLGNFGSALSISLTHMGHEVVAADYDMDKVESYKDQITHTIQVNGREMSSLQTLPLQNADAVIVGIGEDFGSSVEVTANLKQIGVPRLIARAITAVHQTVLEAIGVDEIIHPEQETAERLAHRLEIKGVLDSFDIASGYKIVEAAVPERYVGKTVAEVDFRKNYNVNIVTIVKKEKSTNSLGIELKKENVVGVFAPDRKFEEDDILVLFGAMTDMDSLLDLK